jgi:hypothetical protein
MSIDTNPIWFVEKGLHASIFFFLGGGAAGLGGVLHSKLSEVIY